MDSAVVKNAAEPRSVDPVWTRIREAAQAAAAAEPVLAKRRSAITWRGLPPRPRCRPP